jgi:hypothetical protein
MHVAFYDKKYISKIEWWLDDPALPEIRWACLRVFSDKTADVSFGQENIYYCFINEESASNFLSEDEYRRLIDYEEEDERSYSIPFTTLHVPTWHNELRKPQEVHYIGEY